MKNFKSNYGDWIEVANDQIKEQYFKDAVEQNRVWTVFQDRESLDTKIVSGFYTHNRGSGYVISKNSYSNGEWIEYNWF
jgi:hypothetical protein